MTNTMAEVPDQECRRYVLALLGAYRFDEVERTVRNAEPDAEVAGFVLQRIALELLSTSMTLEDETAPAVGVLGAMVGGLFGTNVRDSAHELLVNLNAASQRLRAEMRA